LFLFLELRHFIHLAENKNKFIAKYFEKRGKPLELVEALERIDQSNAEQVSYLCNALQLILLEIVSNYKMHMESATHASRFFLKSYGKLLDLLFNSIVPHRRIALKLMTALVCVDPQMGRQLLGTSDILTNERTIEKFLSHTKSEIEMPESVRKCYVHFIMSFLVDENPLLVKYILDRTALIKGLIVGLWYDDHVTVSVVLSTLKKSVLESPQVSKTKKLQIFDYDCCKLLVRLFDWKGPRVFAAIPSGKSIKDLGDEQIQSLIDETELQSVSDSVHKFLTLLLTSRKYGVAFDTVSNYREKHNVLQGKQMSLKIRLYEITKVVVYR